MGAAGRARPSGACLRSCVSDGREAELHGGFGNFGCWPIPDRRLRCGTDKADSTGPKSATAMRHIQTGRGNKFDKSTSYPP